MTLYKNKYRVESTRMAGYDYSLPGYYFFTTVTKNREDLFGEIIDGKMVLNHFGTIVNNCWFDLPNHYANIILDEFVVMPNHVHGIIQIVEPDMTSVETGLKPVSTDTGKTHGLFEFIRALKTFSSRKVNETRNTTGQPVWQSRFHDRIIRDDIELNNIRKYIKGNPKHWDLDNENIEQGNKSIIA